MDPARRVVLAGFDAADAARLAELLDGAAQVSADDDSAHIFCLGPRLEGLHAAAFLQRAAARNPTARHVVLAAGREPELFQDFVDSDAIFFISRRPPPLGEVAALLRSALDHDEHRKRMTGAAGALAVARAIARVVDRIATE